MYFAPCDSIGVDSKTLVEGEVLVATVPTGITELVLLNESHQKVITQFPVIVSFTNFRCIYESNEVVVFIPFWIISAVYSDVLEITNTEGIVTSSLPIVVVSSKVFKGATFSFVDYHQQEVFYEHVKNLQQKGCVKTTTSFWDYDYYFNANRELRLQGNEDKWQVVNDSQQNILTSTRGPMIVWSDLNFAGVTAIAKERRNSGIPVYTWGRNKSNTSFDGSLLLRAERQKFSVHGEDEINKVMETCSEDIELISALFNLDNSRRMNKETSSQPSPEDRLLIVVDTGTWCKELIDFFEGYCEFKFLDIKTKQVSTAFSEIVRFFHIASDTHKVSKYSTNNSWCTMIKSLLSASYSVATSLSEGRIVILQSGGEEYTEIGSSGINAEYGELGV
eukprot:TRINITY_DN16700_c0_g1_i1.p2 TRINITY_DN16700_c0_g1~~TRINITY_DN16700_c0_g1_i1.p2  ORF type:complete len:391 (-),score=74.52 TRINITY_DN16700_c0_g1_i1:1294-2466(-)